MEKNWNGYLTALGKTKIPQDTKDFPTTEGNTVSTGFIEWKAKNPKQQAQYDPMSLNWKGVQASEAAATSVYKSEYESVNKNIQNR
jgi:hypothetical protein